MAPGAHRLSSAMSLSNTWRIVCLFWILSSTALAASAVLGIDFGTQYIKATIVKPGIPLDIVLTKDSRRKEISAVAFKPSRNTKSGNFPERIYGSDAIALAPRFPTDVYPNLKSLVGLPEQNPRTPEYAARHPALKIEKDKARGTVAFRSGAFNPDEEPFSVEEIVAMELQNIRKNAEAMGGKVKDVVITIPPYYTAEEKRAIELAADLAGLNILSLISDGLAVGLNYATTRTFPSVTEGGKPELHLVFDMGAGSTKATVLKFQGRTIKDIGKFNKTIQEVEVLGTGWDRTLGGDALNAVIINDMVTSFLSSKAAKAASIPAESVQKSGRSIAKLSKEAERIRHVLSANADTQASLEGLYEDIDFKYKLSRADFEKMIEEYVERVRPIIETSLANARVRIDDLDSVILHGGAARTPIFQRRLEKIFENPDKIRSNVNADEAAAFGAGFLSARISPSFRVKEILTYEVAGYPVGMKWVNNHEKDQQQRLFNAESRVGKEKTLSFQNQRDFQITFYQHVDSSENVLLGSAEKEISRISLTNLTASIAEMKDKHSCTDRDILAKIGVRLSSRNGEVEITKAVLQCELEEEEKDSVVDSVKGLFGFGKKAEQAVLEDGDPAKAANSESGSSTTMTTTSASSATPSPQDGKLASGKRLILIPLEYNTEIPGYPQLGTENFTRMKGRLAAFDASDKARILREEALNQLEAFTYYIRDLITTKSFIEASTEAERASLVQKAEQSSDWLYGDGADASHEELKARLKELKDIAGPIDIRREEAEKRPEKIRLLKEALNSTLGFIDTIKGQIKASEEAASSSTIKSTENSETRGTSVSVEAAESPSTTAEQSPVADDFASLEDEDTSKTSAAPSSATPEAGGNLLSYKMEDLTDLISTYESVHAWLQTKLEEQEALAPNQDPVFLAREVEDKTQELTTASMEIIMRVMNVPEGDKRSYRARKGKTSKTSKTKTPKSSKSSKVKKSKASKTKGAETPKVTEIRLGGDEKQDAFKGAGGEETPTAFKEDKKHKIDEL